MTDIQILNEEHKVFHIGKKRRLLEIEMLTMDKYYNIFLPLFYKFLSVIKRNIEAHELKKLNFPENEQWENKEFLINFNHSLNLIFSYKIIRDNFIELLKKCGYLRMSKRYFTKNVKPIEIINIFQFVYKFNIDDFKKKTLEMIEMLGLKQQLPTSIETCSTEAGLNQKLPVRFPRLKI